MKILQIFLCRSRNIWSLLIQQIFPLDMPSTRDLSHACQEDSGLFRHTLYSLLLQYIVQTILLPPQSVQLLSSQPQTQILVSHILRHGLFRQIFPQDMAGKSSVLLQLGTYPGCTEGRTCSLYPSAQTQLGTPDKLQIRQNCQQPLRKCQFRTLCTSNFQKLPR